jgi:hypothetical protein
MAKSSIGKDRIMEKRALKQKCAYLADWMYKSCEATTNAYVPSQFQLEEYCSTGSHIKCPFYLNAMDSRAMVSIGDKKMLMKER